MSRDDQETPKESSPSEAEPDSGDSKSKETVVIPQSSVTNPTSAQSSISPEEVLEHKQKEGQSLDTPAAPKEKKSEVIEYDDEFPDEAPVLDQKVPAAAISKPLRVNQFGELPLDELKKAFEYKIVEPLEPTHSWGPFKLAKKPYKQPLFIKPPSVHDVVQGEVGDCWLLSAVGSLLMKEYGAKVIAGMMRDMSEVVEGPDGQPITLGKLYHLKNDQVILVRLLKNEGPHYVLIDKSEIDSSKRTQSPFYIQVLEKAFVGLYFNQKWSNLGAASPKLAFDAILGVGHLNSEDFLLDAQSSREQARKLFTEILSKKQLNQKQARIIFGKDEIGQRLTTEFNKLLQRIPPETKVETLTPEQVLAKIAQAIKLQGGASEKYFNTHLKPYLEDYTNKLQTDENYRPIIIEQMQQILVGENKSQQKGLSSPKCNNKAMVFGTKKLTRKTTGLNGEAITKEGFIGTHAFMIARIVPMIFDDVTDAKAKPIRANIVVLHNPWGYQKQEQWQMDEKETKLLQYNWQDTPGHGVKLQNHGGKLVAVPTSEATSMMTVELMQQLGLVITQCRATIDQDTAHTISLYSMEIARADYQFRKKDSLSSAHGLLFQRPVAASAQPKVGEVEDQKPKQKF